MHGWLFHTFGLASGNDECAHEGTAAVDFYLKSPEPNAGRHQAPQGIFHIQNNSPDQESKFASVGTTHNAQ